jgi:hypothetical protein
MRSSRVSRARGDWHRGSPAPGAAAGAAITARRRKRLNVRMASASGRSVHVHRRPTNGRLPGFRRLCLPGLDPGPAGRRSAGAPPASPPAAAPPPSGPPPSPWSPGTGSCRWLPPWPRPRRGRAVRRGRWAAPPGAGRPPPPPDRRRRGEGDHVVARPVAHDRAGPGQPASARSPSRSRFRASRGASVATTIMMLPSPPSRSGTSASSACWKEYRPSSRPPGTVDGQHAAVVALHQHAHRPAAQRRRQAARRRADPALPAERHRPGPGTHAPLRHRPGAADSSAATTCPAVMGRERMSFRAPSFVSPTTGLMERTSSMPGRSSSQAAMASAARQTHRVHVRRIGVSSSPSSRTCVAPTSLPNPLPTTMAAGTRDRNRSPPWGRMAVTPVRPPPPPRRWSGRPGPPPRR